MYLTDIDAPLVNKVQNQKQPAYVPVSGFINVLLTDRVIMSYQQGEIRKFMEGGFLQVFILDNPALTVTNSSVSNLVLTLDDRFVLIDSSSGPVDVFLPPSLGNNQDSLTIKRSSADVNPITVHIQPGDLLDGSVTSYMLLDPSDWVELFPDGATGWWRSGEYNVGGGGGGGTPMRVQFEIANPAQYSYNLVGIPLSNTLSLYLNGIALTEGVSRDYTRLGNVVTLVPSNILFIGDYLLASYAI